MRIRCGDAPAEVREEIRGGAGKASVREYVRAGGMEGVEFVSVVTLEPGSSVGDHEHPREEELYYILSGEGEGRLDREPFRVGPGDAFLCKAGHSHGLVNDSKKPLAFLAILSRLR